MRLHLLITLVKSSEYFRFVESLRTCIMASQQTARRTNIIFCHRKGRKDKLNHFSFKAILQSRKHSQLERLNWAARSRLKTIFEKPFYKTPEFQTY